MLKSHLVSLTDAAVRVVKKAKSLSKLIVSARFRIPYYLIVRQHVRSGWWQLYVAWRWRRKSDGRPHGLPTELIVSLTSFPPRFGILSLTLRSFLLQTVKADHTVLWIAHADIASLPKDVTDLQAAGLEIRTTDDTKSYKKIVPALDAFPDAFICTADDNVYYWPTWLEQLVNGLLLEPPTTMKRVVVCHRAHRITLDPQGHFRPYQHWLQDVFETGKSTSLFPTGMGGVLYPPGILLILQMIAKPPSLCAQTTTTYGFIGLAAAMVLRIKSSGARAASTCGSHKIRLFGTATY